MKIIILLRGISGSGKSTFSDMLKNDLDALILSKDHYRTKNGAYFFDRNLETEINDKFQSALDAAIESKQETILIDNLNISQINCNKIINKAKDYFSIAVNFIPDDIIEHEKRNTKGIEYNDLKETASVFKPNLPEADLNFDIIPDQFATDSKAAIENIVSASTGQIGKANKPTGTDVNKRISMVYEMIIKGASRPFILRYAAEKWDLKERQIDTYIKKAHSVIIDEAQRIKEDLLDKCVTRLEDLYKKNYTVEDFRECRNIIADKRKLFGLDEPIKKQVSHHLTEQPLFGPDSENG